MRPNMRSEVDLEIEFSQICKVNVVPPAGWWDQMSVGDQDKNGNPLLSVVPLSSEFFTEDPEFAIPIRPLFPRNDHVVLDLPEGDYRIVWGRLHGNVTAVADKTAQLIWSTSSTNVESQGTGKKSK